ncbi:DUF2235 domain-containing protein [Salipiger bermudensis]|uniref:DUF2235 domain-containing protein n=1 Tax=Salipiger bermudensis TaxID=344736 RepID=UPI001C99B9EB|nr:DUF2235 domain-containing protein [Salipiger bermudensis]MBY6006681.1 DUF2235 domain-containing protein [Salipiger bermudensis]
MANLVVCCDGTWNTPTQEENGIPSATNVFKFYSSVAEDSLHKTYYRPGVGTTGSLWDRAKGGGFGVGLDDDIKSAYYWLCETYRPADFQPGSAADDIFLIGFSRGAFAVRSLAGVIGKCGLLSFHTLTLDEEEKWRRVDKAYEAYRKLPVGEKWQTEFDRSETVRIKFLGVWDTVGALGIPDEFLINFLDDGKEFAFHDTELGKHIDIARHAVALDERRRSFAPTLWTVPDPDGGGQKVAGVERAVAGQDVEQRWFAGVHGDVGGSYANRDLGDLTLKWMVSEAGKAGLEFKPSATSQIVGSAQGPLHNSVKGFIFANLKTRPRGVPRLDPADPFVDSSVTDRRESPPITQPEYWPTKSLATPGDALSMDIFARPQWNYTGIYLEEGVEYRFSASGEWLDKNIRCTPDGAPEGFHFGYALVKPLDWYQRRRRQKTGNPSAAIPFARREQDMPWFCLVGVIANGTGVHQETRELCPHDVFRIGSSATRTPTKGGYLYCFANDIWYRYGNNKGKVRLTIKR